MLFSDSMRKSLLGETLVLSWQEDRRDDLYVVYRDVTNEDLDNIEKFINNSLKEKFEVNNWVLSRHIVSSDY